MARPPNVRYRPGVKQGTQLPGGRPGYTINMSSGRGELREYTRIGPRAPLQPPTPVIRESSRPPRGNVQYIPPGGAPRRGPVVPLIDGRKPPSKGLRPYRNYPWRFAPPLRPLLRVHPMFRAVDMGFQFLEGWSKYGPETPGDPGSPATLDFSNTNWLPWNFCPEQRTVTHVDSTTAPLNSPCLAGQAGGTPENAIENYVWPSAAGFIPVYRGLWEAYETVSGLPRTRAVGQMYLPARTSSPQPEYVPATPPQPGRQTVQRAPATDTPPLVAVREAANGPREPIESRMPYEVPAQTLEVNPGGLRQIPNTPHVLAPPRSGGRELKINLHVPSGDAAKLASKIWDQVSHYNDLIDILADSIEGNPCRRGTPQEQVLCIVRNFDKIDPHKLAYNWAWNELEDRLVGKALSYSKRLPFGGMAPSRYGDRPQLKIRPTK